ncbi:hypothetical protein DFH09DRAFT_1100403 [Mycena vulgaris]|nr:hypothetical protein DFH09DRAFT_1100403 [Mycena vulgaris]
MTSSVGAKWGQISKQRNHWSSHLQSVTTASLAADLARYDTDIGTFQEVLARVISDRAELPEYSRRCCSLVAPMRRLPTEILGKILCPCAPEQTPFFAGGPRKSRRDNIERLAQLSAPPGAQWPWGLLPFDLVVEPLNYWLKIRVPFPPMGNLPLLERLKIGGPEHTPKLRQVSFPSLDQNPPALPWTQLRQVTYESGFATPRFGDDLAVMSRYPNNCAFNIFHLNPTNVGLPISDFAPIRSDIPTFNLSLEDD